MKYKVINVLSTTTYPTLKTIHQVTHNAILSLRYVEIVKNPCRSRVMTFLINTYFYHSHRKGILNYVYMYACAHDQGLVSQYICSATVMQAFTTSTQPVVSNYG